MNETFKQQRAENKTGTIETIEVFGTPVEVMDIAPSPERIKSPVPVILIPGWGGTPEAHHGNIETLVASGHRVISVNAPHGVSHRLEEKKKNVPESELRKVAALIEVIEAKGLEQFDAVGYSEGGMDAAYLALLCDKIRNLVLINPAGIIGKTNELKLATGFLKDAALELHEALDDEKVQKDLLRFLRETGKAVMKDPFRSAQEVATMSKTDVLAVLAEVKTKGVGISIIHSVDDALFRMSEVQKMVKEDHIDGFYSVKGGHFAFPTQGEEYTLLVDQALSALEKKNQKHTI